MSALSGLGSIGNFLNRLLRRTEPEETAPVSNNPQEDIGDAVHSLPEGLKLLGAETSAYIREKTLEIRDKALRETDIIKHFIQLTEALLNSSSASRDGSVNCKEAGIATALIKLNQLLPRDEKVSLPDKLKKEEIPSRTQSLQKMQENHNREADKLSRELHEYEVQQNTLFSTVSTMFQTLNDLSKKIFGSLRG